MDVVLENFRGSYEELATRIHTSLTRRAQRPEEIRTTRNEVLQFMAAAELVRSHIIFSCHAPHIFIRQHVDIFPLAEYNTLCRSIDTMVAVLDTALQESEDPPDDIDLDVARLEFTGRSGRPRFEVDRDFLSIALESRGPADIARTLGCSSRTVRRRALDHGLLVDGQAPFLDHEHFDGNVVRVWNGPIRHTRLTDISDENLDRVVSQILTLSPHFGRRMIDGALKSRGLHVSLRRIVDSYRRVHGPSVGLVNRRISRRAYHSAGVNSVWHHDGQHGGSFKALMYCSHGITSRTNPVRDGNACFYRWQVTIYCRCSGAQQQQGSNSSYPFLGLPPARCAKENQG